jgi:outer membrane immunogenic protein
MKRFIALTVVLTALAGFTQIASAGPERMESKSVASAPAPACDWTGFYIGLQAGVGNYESNVTDNEYFFGFDTAHSTDINGLFGGQLGYNWQKGAIVFGVEADGAWANFDAHNTANPAGLGDYFKRGSEIDFLGTVRGRVGLAYENVLVYVTGGVAFADGERHARYNEDGANIATEEYADWKADDFRVGVVGGVGVEYMATCNWTVKAETLFAAFGEDTAHDSSGQNPDFTYTFQDQVWMVRLGLNYKFGGFGRH